MRIRESGRHLAVTLLAITAAVSGCSSAHFHGSPEIAPTAAPQFQNRLLARTADVHMTVQNVRDAANGITALVSARGGYVQHEDESQHAVDLSVRVPDSTLAGFLAALPTVGKVKSQSLAAADVTEQVEDIEARLVSLTASRDRLRQLLDRASSVTDVITVEHELSQVQTEIETLQARQRDMRRSVAFAVVNINAARPVVLGPLGVVAAAAGWLIGKLFVLQW